jgi:hypothetical protein
MFVAVGGTVAQAATGSYSVNVGYADDLRPNPANFPTPWDGNPNVIFEGCTPNCGSWDGGAVELVNTSGAAETVGSVVINFSTACNYDIWPHDVTLPAGDEMIFTETATGGGNGCTPGQGYMDSSDIGPGGADWSGNCTQSGVIPQITATVDGTTTVFADSGQVLNTKGVDGASCNPTTSNESSQWTPVGRSSCPGLVVTPSPAKQSLAPGATATVSAVVTDGCSLALSGVPVTFTVTSGPDKGATSTVVTGSTGKATTTLSSASATGIDTVLPSVTNTVGTVDGSAVTITWGTAKLSVTPATAIPGTSVSFTGSGFGAGESVSLHTSPDDVTTTGPALTTVTATSAGAISGTFTVPIPTTSGAGVGVEAVGGSSGRMAWAPLSTGCTDDWNGGSGNFATAADWSADRVPGSTDEACIIAAGTYTVTANSGQTVGSLLLGAKTGTQTLLVNADVNGGTTFDTVDGGSVGVHGALTLGSTDADSGSVLGGGPITNDGTVTFAAGAGNTRFLRADLTNDADGKVVVADADTRIDSGTTLTNAGALSVPSGGALTVSGSSTIDQTGGTFAVAGSVYDNGSTWDQSGGTVSGTPVTLQSTTLNDAAGTGSFVLQCSDTLSGTVPSGQTVDVQANGCGSASLTLSGAVENHGTIDLDSLDQDNYSLVAGGSLTNDGTFATLAGSGGTRYVRSSITNDADGTVEIGGANTQMDQTTTFTNDGTFTVDAGEQLSAGGGAVLDQAGGTLTTDGTLDANGTTWNQTGGTASGTPVILQSTTFDDSAGTGSFVLQCSNTLSGTVPAGQTVNVQGNGCGSASLTLSGNVDNAGTLELDSDNPQAYALVTGSGTLTNDGTLETLADGGNVRYLRVGVVNDPGATVTIAGADTRMDSGTSLTNDGTMTVSAGGQLSLTGGSSVTQAAGSLAVAGHVVVNGSSWTQSGGSLGTSAVTLQGSTFTDSGGTGGSFFLQCSDTVPGGTIPTGQLVDVQGSGCGNASTNVSAPLTNDGTLQLDSVSASESALIGGSTITNIGTVATITGSGNNRYVRSNLVNDPGATVSIGATTLMDSGTTFTNGGAMTVTSTGHLDLSNGSNVTETGGTFVDTGSTYENGGTWTQSGGTVSGSPVILQNTTLADSAGKGSFVLQCGNTLSGTVPAGQTVNVQANGCGGAPTSLSGTVTNDGTLELDSLDADNNSFLNGPGSLVNNGTLKTLGSNGGTRYLRVDVVNSATGKVTIGGRTLQDSSTSFANSGSVTIADGAVLALNSGSTFTQVAGATLGVTVDPATSGGYLTGGVLSVAGTLAVTTVGSPTSGSTYYVLPANSLSGTFGTVSSGATAYTVTYNGTGQPGVVLTAG